MFTVSITRLRTEDRKEHSMHTQIHSSQLLTSQVQNISFNDHSWNRGRIEYTIVYTKG